MYVKHIIAIVGMLIWCSGCRDPKPKKPQRSLSKKELIQNNKKSVRVESDQIDLYIRRRGWDMEKTRSGLHYMIYEEGAGKVHPEENDTVFVQYKVSLINGKEIYSSTKEEPASFVVGYDDVESGLQEGIRFLTIGDKAMMIIPAHLAHGYTGDFNKIPRSSTVIFDIELLDIK